MRLSKTEKTHQQRLRWFHVCCVSDWIKQAVLTEEENSILNVLKEQAQSQKAKFKNAVLSTKKKKSKEENEQYNTTFIKKKKSTIC